MPTIKKLEIGESYVLKVVRVSEVTTGKWPEYHWLGADGVTVVTPKAAADRQLEKRLKMTLETVTGETIVIHRAPNLEDAAKSWWNFDIATQADLKTPAPPKRLTGPTTVPGDAPPPTDADAPPAEDYPVPGNVAAAMGGRDADRAAVWEKIGLAYEWALNMARVAQLEAAANEEGLLVTMETVQAGAATLLIQAERLGAIR